MGLQIKKLDNQQVRVNDTKNGPQYYDPQATLKYTQGGKAVGVFYAGRLELDLFPDQVDSYQVGSDPLVVFSGDVKDLMDVLGELFFFPKLSGGSGGGDNIYNSEGTLTADRQLQFGGNNLQFGDLFGANNLPSIYFDNKDTLGEGLGTFIKIGDLNDIFAILSLTLTGSPLEPRMTFEGGNLVARFWQDFIQLKSDAAEITLSKDTYIETAGGFKNKTILDIPNLGVADIFLDDSHFQVVSNRDATIVLPDSPTIGTTYRIFANGFNLSIEAQGLNLIRGLSDFLMTGNDSIEISYLQNNNWLILQ